MNRSCLFSDQMEAFYIRKACNLFWIEPLVTKIICLYIRKLIVFHHSLFPFLSPHIRDTFAIAQFIECHR